MGDALRGASTLLTVCLAGTVALGNLAARASVLPEPVAEVVSISAVKSTYAVQSLASGSVVRRGLWRLDEAGSPSLGVPANNVIKDSVGSGTGNFPAYGLTPGPSVTLHSAPMAGSTASAGHSYYFPGWRDEVTSGGQVTVDPYASSARIPNQPNGLLDVGRVPPKISGSSTSPVFSASLFFNADDMSSVIGTAWSNGGASPNLLQKGLASHNGQWKISLEPVTSSVSATDPQFGMNCAFQGQTESSDGTPLVTNVVQQVSTPRVLFAATRYKVGCDLFPGGLARITVWSVDGDGHLTRVLRTSQNPAEAYTTRFFTVTSCSDVWFGKKGGGGSSGCYTPPTDVIDDAHDAFRGSIDNISIATTPPG